MRLLAAVVTGSALIGFTGSGLSQDVESVVDPDKELVLEELVVTGTRIRRPDYTSLSPVVSVDTDIIRLGGYTQLEDVLNDLPQVVPGFDRSANNPGNGAAELDLRGLGSNRTLIMLNGRRAAPQSVFGAVNINTIPAGLVERVEVVTGGASTVYGSDAVTGVVNFILNTDYEGMEARVQYDTFEEGDGTLVDANLIFGFGEGPGHITGFINVQDRDDVLAGDRPFTSERFQEDFFTGELIPAGSPGTPEGVLFFGPFTLPDGSVATPLPGFPATVTFNPDGSPRQYVEPDDLYNFQPSNYLQTPLERQMVGLFGDYEFEAARGFVEFLYSENEATSQLAPPVAFSFLATNIDHPRLTADQRTLLTDNFDPDGDGIAQFFLGRRLLETGPRRLTRDSQSLRVVVGAEGALNSGWDWNLAFSYSETDADVRFENGVLSSRLQQALFADPASSQCFDPGNGCVPISILGPGAIPDEAVPFLRANDIFDQESVEEQIFTATIAGEPFELPAGTVSTVFGVEWRDLSSEIRPDPNLVGGGIFGYNSSSAVDGGFDVKEAFFETYIPVFASASGPQSLGIEAGYRYADYSLSGGVGNWKMGLDWTITDSVRVRVMQQRATRAPNIDELFRQPFESFGVLNFAEDYCSAASDPVGNGLTDVCVAQGIPADLVGIFEATPGAPVRFFDGGGNRDLAPEEADTLTAGVVVQTQGGWSFSADYFDIEITDAIGSVGTEGLFNLCAQSASASSPFCTAVERGPAGDINRVTNIQFNLAEARAEGIDVAASKVFELPAGAAAFDGTADLSLRVVFSHTMESGRQSTALSPFVDCAGFFSGLCGPFFGNPIIVPENRATTRLTYASGPLDLNLNWQWIGKLDNHKDVAPSLEPGFNLPSVLDEVPSQNYFDLSARYQINDNFEVFGGISNLFEEDPPSMGIGATQSNTAPQLYDVFGRRFFLGLSYRL